MYDFLFQYGLFFAKALTVIGGIALLIVLIVSLSPRKEEKEHLEIKKLNDKYNQFRDALNARLLGKKEWKAYDKKRKATEKQPPAQVDRKRIFVIEFDGDIKASATDAMAQEITALLTVAKPSDEVFVRLYSAGGLVHAYGLAASQLMRIREAKIPLTICVDKVAASGGYMMACVANRILAAPFSIIGSIGVVGQMPNLHRVLKKHDIDYELHTAGKFKRTLTLFGENTDEAREKFQRDLEDTHTLFKNFIQSHRPQVDLDRVATGEYWHGTQAVELNLIDEVSTSDAYLLNASESADIYELHYSVKRGIAGRLQDYLGRLGSRSQENYLPFVS